MQPLISKVHDVVLQSAQESIINNNVSIGVQPDFSNPLSSSPRHVR